MSERKVEPHSAGFAAFVVVNELIEMLFENNLISADQKDEIYRKAAEKNHKAGHKINSDAAYLIDRSRTQE